MKPKISIIISTKNEEKNIENCLRSIKLQTISPIEIIVVDNYSEDKTLNIAKKFTSKVYRKGPERSSQRNFGAVKATGDYVLFVDADMVLTPNVVMDCIKKISNSRLKCIVIPEKSFGKSFWAKCKALERSYYVGVDWIEGARFFDRKKFLELGGYNRLLVSGEDWDLHSRFTQNSKCGRINNYILHNEGSLSLKDTVGKKYYYAKNIHRYKSVSNQS